MEKILVSPQRFVTSIFLAAGILETSFLLFRLLYLRFKGDAISVKTIFPFLQRRRRQQSGSALINQVLFFPDTENACFEHFSGALGCYNKGCSYSHADNNAFGSYLRYISSAKHTLDVCMFHFSESNLADVLIRALHAGKIVRVITDSKQVDASGSQVANLVTQGVPVRTDASSYFMHHKFIIVDRSILLNGSFNWSRQAVLGNRENVIVTNDAEVLGKFTDEFEKLWSLYEPTSLKPGTV